MEVLKKKRILALIGIVGLIAGCILPYYSYNFIWYKLTISLWDYWEGKVVLFLALANTLFIFKDYIEKYIPKAFESPLGKKIKDASPKMALLPTILVAAFAVTLIIRLDLFSGGFNYGIGFFILWIGIIALIAHALIYKPTASATVQQPASAAVEQTVQQPAPAVVGMPVQQSTPAVEQPVQQPAPAVEQPVQQPAPAVVGTPVQQPAPAVEPVQLNPNIKFCPQCGNQVNVAATDCNMCGHKF